MCAYKCIKAKFEVFGMQTKIENLIEQTQRDLYLSVNRNIFALIDEWIDLDMRQIRHLESKAKYSIDRKLDQMHLTTREANTAKVLLKIEELDVEAEGIIKPSPNSSHEPHSASR